MKTEQLRHFADGATGLAVSTGIVNKIGWLHYLNDNAAGIGVLLTAFFGVFGLIFYYLTWQKSTQADQNKMSINTLENAFDEHKAETKEEFTKLGDGINDIISTLKR